MLLNLKQKKEALNLKKKPNKKLNGGRIPFCLYFLISNFVNNEYKI